MTRPIKFRAWDKSVKAMYSHEDMVKDGWKYEEVYNPIEGLTMLQFTGLHDKNGKEIYEGDILLRKWDGQLSTKHEETTEVYWENGWYLKPQPTAFPAHAKGGEMVEVIGNIYENPELIK